MIDKQIYKFDKKLKLIVLWVMANQTNLKERETNKQIWKGA